MKYIIFLILSLILFLAFNSKSHTDKLTKVIITIPNLTTNDIDNHLKNEFNNIANIDFIDGSIVTNTIVLQVDEQTFNKTNVESMLSRWGLEVDEFSFLDISSTSSIE